MNGAELPMLNGYPLRLVVPGYFGTYWIKHVTGITVLDKPFDGFWMASAYRIPENACACIEPGTTAAKTVPIGRFNVRSFLTSLPDGARIRAGRTTVLRGIAFDGGHGITRVEVSADDGQSWQAGTLGRDLGPYSFREWTLPFTPRGPGAASLKVRATNAPGETQPLLPTWNPAGYMRNVVETTRVVIA